MKNEQKIVVPPGTTELILTFDFTIQDEVKEVLFAPNECYSAKNRVDGITYYFVMIDDRKNGIIPRVSCSYVGINLVKTFERHNFEFMKSNKTELQAALRKHGKCWDFELGQLFPCRVEIGESYWFVDSLGVIIEILEDGSPTNYAHFRFGNYFHTREVASVYQKDLTHFNSHFSNKI